MLKDEVWDQIALPTEVLCFACIETLLCRPLTIDDLLDCPGNHATIIMVKRAGAASK